MSVCKVTVQEITTISCSNEETDDWSKYKKIQGHLFYKLLFVQNTVHIKVEFDHWDLKICKENVFFCCDYFTDLCLPFKTMPWLLIYRNYMY